MNKTSVNIQILEAGTGTGKSYNASWYALLWSLKYNESTVIATSSLALVDQIYDELENLYNRDDIQEGGSIRDKKTISIMKHTRAEFIEAAELFLYFSRGSSIIVTVHQYVREDLYKRTPGLFYMVSAFSPVVNLICDESQFFVEGFCETTQIYESQFFSKNSHQWCVPYNNSFRSEAVPFKILAPSFYDKKLKDPASQSYTYGMALVPANILALYKFKVTNPEDDPQSPKTFSIIKTENSQPFASLSMRDVKLEDVSAISDEGYVLKSDNIVFETLTQKVFSFEFDSDCLKNHDFKVKELFDYNMLCSFFQWYYLSQQQTIHADNARMFARLNNLREKEKSLDNEEKTNKLLSEIEKQIFVPQEYILERDLEKNILKEKFSRKQNKKIVDNLLFAFANYKRVALRKGLVDGTRSIVSANEAFFYNLISSRNFLFVTNFPSYEVLNVVVQKKNDVYVCALHDVNYALEIKPLENSSEFQALKAESLQQLILLKYWEKETLKSWEKEGSERKAQDSSDESDEVKKTTKSFVWPNFNDPVKTFFGKDLIRTFELPNEEELKKMSIENNKFWEDIRKRADEQVVKIRVVILHYPTSNSPYSAYVTQMRVCGINLLLANVNNAIFLSAQQPINKLQDLDQKLIAEAQNISGKIDYSSMFNYTSLEDIAPQMDTVFLLFTNKNYFQLSNALGKVYWQRLGEEFNRVFIKDPYSNDDLMGNSGFGILGLPSDNKGNEFIKKYCLKQYFTRIYGNDEEQITNVSIYNKEGLFALKPALQVCSLFSTASVGVNLPNHFYLHLSFENYLPSNLKYQYTAKKLSGKAVNTEKTIQLKSAVQVVGRLTRKNEREKKNLAKANRIIIMPDPCVHQKGFFLVNSLSALLSKHFKTTTTADLTNLEKLSFGVSDTNFVKEIKRFDDHQKFLAPILKVELKNESLTNLWCDFIIGILKKIRVDGCEMEQDFDGIKKEYLFGVFSFYQKMVFFIMVENLYAFYKKKDKKKWPTFLSHKNKIKLVRSNLLLKATFDQFESAYNKQIEDLMVLKKNKDLKSFCESLYHLSHPLANADKYFPLILGVREVKICEENVEQHYRLKFMTIPHPKPSPNQSESL